MTQIDFAVVPFVKVDSPVRVGTLTLWSSTPKEWQSRFGCDPPALLDLYRDRAGKSLRESLAILSPQAGVQPTFDTYQDAVVVLSTADWLRGISGTASDPWLFEPWRIDSADDDHVRIGKFSMNMTDADNDGLYPDPYTHPVRFNTFSCADLVSRLDPLLVAGDEQSRSRLTALWHLYLARRGAPYFSSAFEDLEAVWSAFEAWYRLPKAAGYTQQSRVAQILRAWAPRTLVRRLRPSTLDRDGRNTLVFRAVVRQLGPMLDSRVEAALRTLLDELYSLRNEQTHGGAPATSRLRRTEEDAHILGLALAVWRVIVEQSLFADSIFVVEELRAKLRDTFLERSINDRLLEAFANTDRKRWCDDAGQPGDRELIARCRPLFEEALDIVVIPRRYRGGAAARNACRTALLALSAWAKAVDSRRGPFHAQQATAGLHTEIGNAAKAAGADPAAVNAAIVQVILRRKLHDREALSDDVLADAADLGGIDFPTWARITVRLHELAVGYELL